MAQRFSTHRVHRQLAASLLLALAGCSTGVHLTSSPTLSATQQLAGNWEAIGTPDATKALRTPIASFTGDFTVSGSTITGVFRVLAPNQPASCPSILSNLAATGTLDSGNNLTITVPLSGGVATLTATLGSNLNTIVNGSYQIVGGTCPTPATPMIVAQYAPVTGTYTGTFNVLDATTLAPVAGTATGITAVLTQSTIANAGGQFPLSGTVTATGACTGTLSFSNGTVQGGGIVSTGYSSDAAPAGDFIGAIDPTASTVTGLFSLFKSCNGTAYTGTLTHQ